MIEIRELTKSYGGKVVLNGLSFTAENGFVTGFVGPNGAGKSTTMRIVACFEEADSGQALVDGQRFDKAALPAKAMGVFLGDSYLPMNMTGKGYLSYICGVSGIAGERISELLYLVGLESAADRLIKSYSLGMKQRLGLASAIVGNPDTLMLDEPVNGLDPMGVQWLRQTLRDLARSGKAVLLSSHLLAELELVADRVVMLDNGHVVSQGDLNNLEQGDSRVLIRTSDDAALATLLGNRGIQVEPSAEGLFVSGLSPRDVGKFAYDSGLLVDSLTESRRSLEELFLGRAAEQANTEGGQR